MPRMMLFVQVHLLNDERGPVIETLIARTQRQVTDHCFWQTLQHMHTVSLWSQNESSQTSLSVLPECFAFVNL